VNKGQLVAALEGRLGNRKAATDALEAVVDTITVTVAKGEKVAITGFGTFERAARAARTGRNPRTGQPVKIKKTSVPRFRAGTAFKQVTSDAKALKAFSTSAATRAASVAAGAAGRATGTRGSAGLDGHRHNGGQALVSGLRQRHVGYHDDRKEVDRQEVGGADGWRPGVHHEEDGRQEDGIGRRIDHEEVGSHGNQEDRVVGARQEDGEADREKGLSCPERAAR
jgi:nucleoid DNA-binding protein